MTEQDAIRIQETIQAAEKSTNEDGVGYIKIKKSTPKPKCPLCGSVNGINVFVDGGGGEWVYAKIYMEDGEDPKLRVCKDCGCLYSNIFAKKEN